MIGWLFTAAHGLLMTACVLLAMPAAVLLAQVLLALLPARANRVPAGCRARVAVLVPAHNESSGLLPTLTQAREQLMPTDRILVVADNCSDDTAAVARAAGAEVTERFNAALRGKGYALDHGVRELAADPPEVVLVLDADCTVAPGCIERLTRLSHATGRPVQAMYLMRAADDGLKMRVAEFAMRVKNGVRPRGASRIGVPCGLTGSGMAFPWRVAVMAPFASGHLAEDMQLGLRLTEAGTPPLFCEEARVYGVFAGSGEGQKSQRTRWEHGHLSLLVSDGPRLLARALLRGRLTLAAQVLDLLVPPLALLAMMELAALAVAVLAFVVLGWVAPVVVSAATLLMLVAAVLLARARYAADIIRVRDLLTVPAYVLRKLPLYARFVFARQREWVRTKRDNR